MDYKKILAKITEKWPAKALSVVAAIFLFAFHRMSDLEERFFSVPLYLDVSANLVPGSNYPRNVRITLRGSNAIYQISETDIEAHLDLTKYLEPGLYKAQVQIQRKGSAAETGIMEINVEPLELTLELDTRMSKNVPVTPNFQGYPEQGFEMVSYTLEPNHAVIDGPEKLLLSITELNTDTINLHGRNADFSATVRIANQNQLIGIRGEGTAEFKAYIKELIVINNLDSIPIRIDALAEIFEAVLDPPAASVKIQGVQSMLDGVNAEIVSLSIDCSGISSAGVYELPLLAESHDEITIDRCEPEVIKVEIRRKAAE